MNVEAPAVGIRSHARIVVRDAALDPLSRGSIDALVFWLFDNRSLLGSVRRLDRVELTSVWRLTQQVLARKTPGATVPLSPIEVHRRMVEGLVGETLLLSSAMFLDSFAEVEHHFGLSFKTIKARLGGSLDTAASEQAMRAARTTMTAAQVLGGFDAARAYMHTRNFALGGSTPAELIRTAEGERIVLNELHAQAEGGPL